MRLACQYAIIRFMPYVETGEFANIGVVLLCPQARYFGFKLLKRYGRITRFFENMEARLYTDTRRIFHDELTRVRQELKSTVFDGRRRDPDPGIAQRLFGELTRHREALIRFDAPRVMLATDPKSALEDLYNCYIERDFATKEYQERLLERGVRQLLARGNLADRYSDHYVGNDDFHVRFPFVHLENESPVKVIKPFHLAHDEPSKILDHGGHWVDRMKRLKRHKLLPPHVLFAVQGPPEAEENRFAAYQEIRGDLTEQGVQVVGAAEESRILAFARLDTSAH